MQVLMQDLDSDVVNQYQEPPVSVDIPQMGGKIKVRQADLSMHSVRRTQSGILITVRTYILVILPACLQSQVVT